MTLADALTLLGLAFAIYQIWQVGGIASATQDAVVRHAQRFGDFSVISLVPELRRLELECDKEAAEDGNPARLSEAMHAWSQTASELKGYLSQNDRASEELQEELQNAIVTVVRAKGKVITIKDGDRLDATKTARARMNEVANSMTQYTAALRVSIDVGTRKRGLPELLKSLSPRKRRSSDAE